MINDHKLPGMARFKICSNTKLYTLGSLSIRSSSVYLVFYIETEKNWT